MPSDKKLQVLLSASSRLIRSSDPFRYPKLKTSRKTKNEDKLKETWN
jgi:hypothetical protein